MQKLGKETIGQKRTNKESEVFMIVRGNAMWASVFDKNTLSDKYQIDICNLDNKTVKELEKAGLKVKSGEGDKQTKVVILLPSLLSHQRLWIELKELGMKMSRSVMVLP